MQSLRIFAAVVVALYAGSLLLPAAAREQDQKPITLTNVSYDPTRELYKDIGEKFAKAYQAKTGQPIAVSNSHAGSGAQARAILGGLKADVATLALASDIDVLEDKGFVKSGWQARNPGNSSPYTSAIVFLVRKGNPKGIQAWTDLVRPEISVITPNPKTSGGARWNFLAAWGSVTQAGGTEAQATEFLRKLFERVPVLDTGSRGATTTFVQKLIGDVLLAWENEAFLALKEEGGGQVAIVYPELTILAEPPVAVVDRVVDQRRTRAAAEAFIQYLYTDDAQEIIAKWGYRPHNAQILAKHADALPPIKKLFTVKDVANTWREAQKKFFASGGVFDQIYQPR